MVAHVVPLVEDSPVKVFSDRVRRNHDVLPAVLPTVVATNDVPTRYSRPNVLSFCRRAKMYFEALPKSSRMITPAPFRALVPVMVVFEPIDVTWAVIVVSPTIV